MSGVSFCHLDILHPDLSDKIWFWDFNIKILSFQNRIPMSTWGLSQYKDVILPAKFVLTSVTLTFDFWPWPFAWTSFLPMAMTPENFMMIWWEKHSEKVWQTDGWTEMTIHRAAWSQLKTIKGSYFGTSLLRTPFTCFSQSPHWQLVDTQLTFKDHSMSSADF